MHSLKAGMKPSIDPKKVGKKKVQHRKTEKKNQNMQVRTKKLVTFLVTPLCNNIEDPNRQNLFRTSDTVDDKEALK